MSVFYCAEAITFIPQPAGSLLFSPAAYRPAADAWPWLSNLEPP